MEIDMTPEGKKWLQAKLTERFHNIFLVMKRSEKIPLVIVKTDCPNQIIGISVKGRIF